MGAVGRVHWLAADLSVTLECAPKVTERFAEGLLVGFERVLA